ncbi:MAG: hypothetical protein M0P31_15515 [Solirubrobacteraceae bacterium]|nr:hypothetical protein [Solirubrobacteraceae bacterium]
MSYLDAITRLNDHCKMLRHQHGVEVWTSLAIVWTGEGRHRTPRLAYGVELGPAGNMRTKRFPIADGRGRDQTFTTAAICALQWLRDETGLAVSA